MHFRVGASDMVPREIAMPRQAAIAKGPNLLGLCDRCCMAEGIVIQLRTSVGVEGDVLVGLYKSVPEVEHIDIRTSNLDLLLFAVWTAG